MTEFTDVLDRNLKHRRDCGEDTPLPGRVRLTGDLALRRVYDNVQDFCGATAHLAVSHNTELESVGGVWLPVDTFWGLLGLRRYELEHARQTGNGVLR